MDPNEQDRLIDRGWTLIDCLGHLLWVDPVDGIACSRDLAVRLQRSRDQAVAQAPPAGT
jgi:hypothetical protein